MNKHDRRLHPRAINHIVKAHTRTVLEGKPHEVAAQPSKPGELHEPDEPLARFGVRCCARMREEHTCLAAFYRFALVGYSSVEQLTVCFLLVPTDPLAPCRLIPFVRRRSPANWRRA